MAQATSLKRKVHYDISSSSPRAQKRQKSKDGREISSQTADMALSTTGELNIASFIRAREFEINALDKSMRKSRQGLMSRAFQQVPRHMRRRTASHNVKKVPRRLRKRAAREMKDDNTPTVNSKTRTPSSKLRLRLETAKALKNLNTRRKPIKQQQKDAKRDALKPGSEKHMSAARIPRLKKNKLAEPPRATSKFKRRQVHKTWLPTHLWHTKRAHMTQPKEPLWRMAIPLKPTEKSYRPTHRAAGSRGCVTWDTSYVSTMECFGTELALESMLKFLGFFGEGWSGQKYKRWKSGLRFAESWVYEHSMDKKPIAPVTVIWEYQKNDFTNEADSNQQATDDVKAQGSVKRTTFEKKKLNRRIMIRVQPSAFHQFWLELMKAAKFQKPQVLVEDLRFEVGSIVIEGPGSTEALVGVLKPEEEKTTTAQVWTSCAGLSNPATLPMNALLAFDIVDPRLSHPPKQVKFRKDDASQAELNELIISWPIDNEQTSQKLFSHKVRYLSGRSMSSQKAINRRKAITLPSQTLVPTKKDASIPVILLAHRSSGDLSNMQGSWELLMPWGGIDAVWRSLMYYPLSSGGTPRFGGLIEIQQVSFEKATPWFPGDFPGTEAGKAWDRTESEKRFDQWIRRPPSRRYAWDALDLGLGRKGELGRGWACDWEYLFTDSIPKLHETDLSDYGQQSLKSRSRGMPHLLTQRQRKAQVARSKNEGEQRRRNTSSPESDAGDQDLKYSNFSQLTPTITKTLFQNVQSAEVPTIASLATIRITLLTRGTPSAAARIYRLPTPLTTSSTAVALANQQTSQQHKATTTEAPPSASQPASEATASLSLFSTTPTSKTKPTPGEIRRRWLSLDPNPTASTSNPHSSTSLPQVEHQKKLRPNHHNDPRVGGRHYPSESLEHIRVFPENAAQEVKEMYGPAPARKTREQALKDLTPIPNTVNGLPEEDEHGSESVWERRHVPCPDAHDLIGFVTSGGYNLAEGKGTAIGAVWVQRVIEGWKKENDEQVVHQVKPTEQEQEHTGRKQQAKLARQRDRERHLCIVRNAGESVGRLGIWELC